VADQYRSVIMRSPGSLGEGAGSRRPLTEISGERNVSRHFKDFRTARYFRPFSSRRELSLQWSTWSWNLCRCWHRIVNQYFNSTNRL